jgi:glycerophosphoryl diester phosphodiesterase
MPRLVDVLAWGGQEKYARLRFNIEIKFDPRAPERTANLETMTTAVIAVIRSAGMSRRVTLQSFDWRALRLSQALAPEIPTAYLTAEQTWLNNVADREGQPSQWTAGFQASRHKNVPSMVRAAGGTIWSPYHGDLSEDVMWQAKQLGLKVIPWTVNDAKDINRVLAMKVDGLITDYPDRALPLLEAAGLKP